MPTSAAEAFAAAGLAREGVIRWGTKPATSASGVYVVSLTDSLHAFDGASPWTSVPSLRSTARDRRPNSCAAQHSAYGGKPKHGAAHADSR